MKHKLLLTIFISVLLLTAACCLVSARLDIVRPDAIQDVNIITYTGNLTNVSEMEDVNVPSPSEGEVFTWNDTTGVWESQTPIAVDTSWRANWTAYNTTWSADTWVDNYSDYYTSAEVDTEIFDNNDSVTNALNAIGFNSTTNDSINNYINENNESVANTFSLYALITNLVNYLGNWSADKVDYYTSVEVDDINTSITNTFVPYTGASSNVDLGNWNITSDWGRFNYLNISKDIHLFADSKLYFGDTDDSIFYQSLDNDFHFAGTGITYLTTTEGLFNFTGSNIDMFGGNVTANYFFGNGSQLTDIPDTWADNYSDYYTSAEVDTLNTSQTNYINANNDSVNNYIDYVNSTNYAGISGSYANDSYVNVDGDTMTGDLKLDGFTNGSVLFISHDGVITENNSRLYYEVDDGAKLAIGDNANMLNSFQVVKEEGITDINNIRALVVSRNTDTTNNNWVGFSMQTEDSVGDVYSGVRLLAQFTNHTNVSGDFIIDTRHEGIRSEKLRLNSIGNLNLSGNFTAVYYCNATNCYTLSDFFDNTDTWVANYSSYYTSAEVDTLNTSQTNYINANNASIENYILEVNATNFQVEVDPYWEANYTAYNNSWSADLTYNDTQNDSIINYITENNNSVNNNLADTLLTTYFNASALNVVTGTGAGNLADIQTYNIITYNVTETNSDYELIVNFTGITEFTTLLVRHKTDADAGHLATIQIWDYSDSRWEGYGYLTEETTSQMKTLGVYDAADHIQDGVVQVRFYQAELGNAGHVHQFDWVSLSKGYGTPVGQETDPLSIHTDGNTPLDSNWGQGAFNLTNVASWFLGLISWDRVNGLNTTINALILDNNASVENTIQTDNSSMNNHVDNQNASQTNYILENNGSIENYVDLNNASVNNWVTNLAYATITYVDTVIAGIGNWSADKDDYYTGVEVTAINTSMKNYVDNNNASQTNYINSNNASVENTIQTDNSSMNNYVVDYVGNNNDTIVNTMVPYTGADKNINISFNNLSVGGSTIWWNGSYLIIT